jgi:hypothetical protein
MGGILIAFVFSDQATGYIHVHGANKKSEFLGCLKSVFDNNKRYHYHVDILRSDDEIVLKSAEVLE